MAKKQERLLLRIEKAGVRASLRSGRVVTEEELLRTRVQVVPLTLRIACGLLAGGAAWASYSLFQAGSIGWALALAFAALVLLLFAIFGFKRTVSNIFDGLDAASSADLIGAALEGIATVAGALLD